MYTVKSLLEKGQVTVVHMYMYVQGDCYIQVSFKRY